MKLSRNPKLLHDGHPATSRPVESRPLYKNVSRWLTAGLLIALSLSGSGCVGTTVRIVQMKDDTDSEYRHSPFYAATRADAEIVSSAPSIVQDGIGRCNGLIVILPFSFLSFPLDIVVDTLCLPYDIYKYNPDGKQDI
jgi:uncharacterized protein YceK